MALTLQDLLELRSKDKTVEILTCTEMLPNRMQCYRGADYIYTNDVTEVDKAPRQVCRYHAKELVEKERQRLQDAQNATANPEPVKEKNEQSETKPELTKTEDKKDVNAKPESHSSYTGPTGTIKK